MKLETGDMWSVFDEADYFLFTGNAIVKNNGALVMGRGIARQVRDRWPGIDMRLGAAILAHPDYPMYGLITGRKLGVFQVKHHWGNPAEPRIIQQSATKLAAFAMNTDASIHMNYPGIGNGRLAREQVEPLLTLLPDNVHIWSFR